MNKELSNEKLKEEFIKYFGVDKWNQENELEKLTEFHLKLCKDYNLDSIPLIVENISEDSRYDIQNDCIIISENVVSNYKEALKCVIHETRHMYQRMVVELEITSHPLYQVWYDNFKEAHSADPNNINQIEDYFKQPIEIDAFAFTKYIFRKYFNEDLICFDLMIEDIFNLYIEKYLNNGL